MSYTLQFTEGGKEKTVDIQDTELLIGRAPDCGLVLAQPGISRHHCKITRENAAVFIEDLNSKNGTRVNNIYIKKKELTPGDSIIVAEFFVQFQPTRAASEAAAGVDDEAGTDRMVLLSDQKELHEEAGTIMRKVSDFEGILKQYDKDSEVTKAVAEHQEEARRIMQVIIEVAKALIAVSTLDEIIEKLMNLIFENLPADRGFLMLKNAEGALEPKVVKFRNQSSSDTIEISQTIANKALNEKMAILTTDAQVDSRFAAGESIRFLGIKSAICVPLFHKQKTIGIIYLDSPTSAAIFKTSDLDLLTAMANFAAVGIEQAQLTQQIQQETSVRERLERYHSPSIVNRILKDIGTGQGNEFHLVAEEREVSILFADIVGFTPLSERMAPGKIAQLLNEYFSEMTEVIFKYEGTLDKYIGDAIMAIFGAPNTMEDHPYRAVSTALEMLEKLHALNKTRTEENQFAIRIGINTGRAVAGDIGSIKRMEYTVLGNTVNMASRIESMASKPNQLVIGETTYKAVADQFEVENLGAIQLKGISEKAQVYRVLSRND